MVLEMNRPSGTVANTNVCVILSHCRVTTQEDTKGLGPDIKGQKYRKQRHTHTKKRNFVH